MALDLNQNKLYIIVGVATLLVIVLLLVLVLGRGFGSGTNTKSVSLQFWGVFDDNGLFDAAIQKYQQQHLNVSIRYKKLNFEDYEKSLLNSFASGTGPDVWLIHNTWLPKHSDKIKPLPQEEQKDTKKPLLTFKDFQDQFVDVAVKDLTLNEQIYSLPLYVDTLALYWNKDIFNSKGITAPPTNWVEFNDAVTRITEYDDSGNIRLAGAAIGTAHNINRSTDILSLLLMQAGTKMTDNNNGAATFAHSVNNQPVGESALQYYTDFTNPAKQLYTWNDSQHYSIDAFQEGKTAMMFNYSHQIGVIRTKSPRLNFDIAPVPQFPGATNLVNYANYWSPTVSKNSPSSLEAWKFIVYLTSAEGAISYLDTANRPAARRDLLDKQKIDPDIGVYATQALSARSWYQVDNQAIETIFADMINDVNFKQIKVRDALQSAENKTSVLMRRR